MGIGYQHVGPSPFVDCFAGNKDSTGSGYAAIVNQVFDLRRRHCILATTTITSRHTNESIKCPSSQLLGALSQIPDLRDSLSFIH